MKILGSIAVGLMTLASVSLSRAADTYTADPVHSSVVFRAHHVGAGFVWGRFNDPAATFTLDESDVTKSTFHVEIPVANVDTHNEKRDGHLKSPDFFNAKQYPTITFQSTAVKKGDGNMLEVTGTLQLHGITKTVTVPVELTGKGEFPAGTKRAGIEATFNVKQSEFEIKGLPGAVSDDIRVIVALEGTKQ